MDYDRLIALSRTGMFSGGIGPELEWEPVTRDEFQLRHNQFWRFVSDVLELEYTDEANDDDLPSWMSEEATTQLRNN